MRRRLSSLPKRRLITLVTMLVALLVAAGAVAYFTSTGISTAAASVGTITPPGNVTAQQSGGDVTIGWSAATLSSGAAVQGYRVTRSDSATVCGSPTLVTALSCTDTGVPAGSYTYTVIAVYNGFTASAAIGSVTILGAPTITVKPSNPSTNSTANFSFSGGGGSGYECQLDQGTFTPDCSNPQYGVVDGSHTFTVRATRGSSRGPSTSYTWTVDSSAPTITTEPANPSNNASPSFSFAHSNSAYSFTCLIDSGGYSTCASPQSYSGLSDGSHTFKVQAVSADGATTTAASYTWIIDTAPPVTTIALSPSPPNGSNGWYTSAPTFTLDATDTNGTGVSNSYFQIDSGPTQTYGGSAVTVPEGQHTITYWSTDAAGNTETKHATATIKVDTVAPTSALSIGGLFWANFGGNSIGEASLSGTGINQSFVTGANRPAGVASDGRYVYWANYGLNSIGRANLNGTGVNQSFITGALAPIGVAVDGTHIYWANSSGAGSIGRANLDGTAANQQFVANAGGTRGVAVDSGHIYWGNISANAVGRANLDGTGVNASFIGGASGPEGVAADGAHLYWANLYGGTIGRANLDGTSVNQSFISGAGGPDGVTVDSSRVYWDNQSFNAIGRANLDGTGANARFILGANNPIGAAAVTPANAFLSGTTLYYNGATGGSFTVTDNVSDAGSGPGRADFPDTSAAGWTHAADTVSAPAGGPYTSSSFTWSANPSNPTGVTITSSDVAGNTTTTPLTFVNDTTAPTGGALTVNGTAATGPGSSSTVSSTPFPISSRSDYTDGQSGVASSTLTVQSETLTGSTCGGPGSGGPFTSATTITGTTQPSGIVAGYCYLYRLTGTDNVGNSTAVSTTVTEPLPTITSVSPAQGVDGVSNLLVTVTGTRFHSDAAVTFSGAGITVNSTTYNSATQLTANITIASSAATSARDVTVTNQADTGSVTSSSAFTIVSRPAAALFVADNFYATVGDDSIAANGQLTPISGGPSGQNGQGVSVTPDGRFAYVSNAGGGSISQYSIAADGTMSSLSPATVAAGSTPRGEAISTDGKTLYVAEFDSNAIGEFTIGSNGQLSPKSPATVAAGGAPYGIALSPDGKALFAADDSGHAVSQYLIGSGGGLSANSPATVAAGNGAIEIAVSPDGTSAYVSNESDGTVSQYTIANDKLTANSPATVNAGGSGAQPHDVVVSPDARSVYVADFKNNNASVVWQYSIGAGGALTSKSPATVSAGSGPWAAAITPDGKYYYVSDLGGSPAGAISEFAVGTDGSLSPLSPSQLVPPGNRSPFAMVVQEAMQIGTPVTLPGAVVGTAYSQPLWSISGTAPVTYAVTSGSLPDGLSLSNAGVISGTPTTTGQAKTFTVTATDSSATPQAPQKVFTLTVQ